jgi:hypothetical protein
MAEYSRQDAEYAAKIMERLLDHQAEGLELESGVAISDVESDVNSFLDELLFLEDLNANVPIQCAVAWKGRQGPLDLSGLRMIVERGFEFSGPSEYQSDGLFLLHLAI